VWQIVMKIHGQVLFVPVENVIHIPIKNYKTKIIHVGIVRLKKMTKQKLCIEHGKDLKKSRWVLVDPVKCELCKLENAFNSVLNQKEFRDLRP